MKTTEEAAAPGQKAGASPLSGHSHLSEGQLARLWLEQTFPPEALTTRRGQRLRVVYRGRPAAGAGPDFRDAIIASPWGLLQGDVELHVRSGDFRRHGHHVDPAYAGVVLHVVFWDDVGVDTPLPGGGNAPVVALGDWVEGRAREIRSWLEHPALWREPCRSAVERWGAAGVGALLDRLGEMRLVQKTAAFRRRLKAESVDQLLWEGVLEALGYGGDREAFRRLAERLPWASLMGELATAPEGRRAGLALRLLQGAAPELSRANRRGRPGNRPEVRLQGAAALAARWTPSGPASALLPLVERGTEKAVSKIIGALTVPRLVGPSRAQEMLVNAVLPCFCAYGGRGLQGAVGAIYARLPLPARYGAVRHLHEALSGVRVTARRQQGMLYLLRGYCCRGACPLPPGRRGCCPLA